MSDEHLISFSTHPLALSGPLLSVVGYIYPDCMVASSNAPFAMRIESASQHADHERVDRFMEMMKELHADAERCPACNGLVGTHHDACAEAREEANE